MESTETTPDQALASLQQAEGISTLVEQVVVPSETNRSLDLETVHTPKSADVNTLGPERAISGKPIATKTLVITTNEHVEAREAVVLAPTVSTKGEANTPGPASTQIEAQQERSTDILTAPLIEDASEVEEANLTLTQIRNSVHEEVQVEMEPVPKGPEPSSAIQPELGVDTIALAKVIRKFDDVEESRASEQSTTVVSQPVESSQIAPREQVARAISLDELHDISGVSARYAGLLKGWLRENMHYPRAARLAGQEGRAIVRFVIDRAGKVSSIQLEQGSGHRILDREAVEMIERAEPFPIMPAEMAGSRLELRVPVVFEIHDESLFKQIPPIFLE